jgi:diadenosine tetraphosphate (Ap4A) HIT family hydrolase
MDTFLGRLRRMHRNILATISGYMIEQCSCPVPGYVIVSPSSSFARIDDADDEHLRALGFVLAKTISVVRTVTAAEKVYCAQFGESGGVFHFHVFPRTEQILKHYRQATCSDLVDDGIPGPLVFHWARTYYQSESVREDANNVARQIRSLLLK